MPWRRFAAANALGAIAWAGSVATVATLLGASGTASPSHWLGAQRQPAAAGAAGEPGSITQTQRGGYLESCGRT
jgi:membrane protein DedA with SNARE-associated domain